LSKSLTALALFLLLISATAQAIYVKAPATIVVQQEQKDVPIIVRNDSTTEENYSIRLLGPVNAVISPSFGRLSEGQTAISSLSIQPKKSLEGSTYQAILEVEIGEELETRNIKLIFKEEQETEANGTAGTDGAGLFSITGFSTLATGLLTFENVLNAFLALVAAVLLIAFIARFTRRLEARK